MPNYLEPVVQKLEADIGEYVAKLAEAKAAMEELQKSTSKAQGSMSKDGDKIEDALGDVGKEAEKTGDDVDKSMKKSKKGFEDAGAAGKKAGDDVDKGLKKSTQAAKEFEESVTTNLKDGMSAFKALSTTIKSTQKDIKTLRKSFAQTGDKDVFGDLKKSESDLKSMMGFIDKMVPGMAKQITKDGEQVGSKFMSSMSEKMSEMGSSPIMIGAVTSLAVGITPIIAGAVGAGFSAAVVGGGIMALKGDPRVKAAASSLKDVFGSTLTGAAQPMLDPLLLGINELMNGVKSLKPALTDLFAGVAPDISPLVEGLVGLAKDALPGFTSAVKSAQPIVAELGADLPQLGAAIGESIDTLASSPGAIKGIDEAFTALDGTLIGVSKTISFMSQSWVQVLIAPWAPLLDSLHQVPKPVMTIADTLTSVAQNSYDVGRSFDSMGDFTKNADDALKALIVTQNAWMKQAQSNDDALLAMKQAQSTFSSELKSGTKNWNENTAAGQKQVGNLNALNESITGYYNGLANGQPLTEKQTAAELKATSALYGQAKQAGATKGELATLKGEVADLSKQLALLHGKTVTVNMVEHFIQTGAKDPTTFYHGTAKGSVVDTSGIVHAAKGFVSGILRPRSPGTLMLAGEPETGGEVFAPLRGISQTRAMSLAQVIGDHYGFDVRQRSTAGAAASIIGAGGPTVASGGGSAGGNPGPINLIMSNQIIAQFQAALISPAQRYKSRTGTTGLT